MTAIGDAAAKRLLSRHVPHDPGMTVEELDSAERQWGFRFADDHRSLLSQLVPSGEGWLDWRNDAPEEIAARLAWPLDGMLFDVTHGSFWPTEWGTKPESATAAESIARLEFESWTQLVPIFSHRYMPAGGPEGSPVFSVYQTDVVVYGSDLHEYVSVEIAGIARREHPADLNEGCEPWLRLAAGWGFHQL